MATADAEVAIGRDSLATIAAISAGGHNFDNFTRSASEASVDSNAPYYNTGMFVCRSPQFLREWSRMARSATLQVNFDQNLFNLTLYGRANAAPVELDPRVWNIHGPMLSRATVTSGNPPAVTVDGEPALILHATSARREDITAVNSVDLDGIRLNGMLYLCRNPALNALQRQVMGEFLSDMAARFHRAGLGEAVAVGS